MNHRIMLALLILAALVLTGAEAAEDQCREPVKTGAGLVQGIAETESAACVWRGIPFAAPPVGELRWRAPQPMPAWSGVRETVAWGHRCMQSGVMAIENLADRAGISEDCLYLNVWRPQKAGTFPVMVWVHGGGYVGGSAFTPMYWGDRLSAAGDVVVVSVNYRLNVFGFLALPPLREEDPNRSVGSYGTLDQVAALHWVQDNIQNFGGDPGNVTIFGESAGGWSICTLLATPLTKGLFHRAILESGGCEESQDLEPGYTAGRAIAKTLGCGPEDVACLRRLPAKTVAKKAGGGLGDMGSFMPHHDGYALTGAPLAMIRAGNYNRVPFMAGSNLDEFGKALKLKSALRRIRAADYEANLVKVFGASPEEARRIVAMYPLAQHDNRPVEAYGRMFGADMSLACPTYLGLLAASSFQPEVYYYRFDYDGMKAGRYFGAAHSFEIPFIFNALDRLPMSLFYDDDNLAEAGALSRIIQAYWLNFAKTGDPNGPGLPAWPRFESGNQKVQVFDTQVRTEPTNFGEKCLFWEEWGKTHHLGIEMMR